MDLDRVPARSAVARRGGDQHSWVGDAGGCRRLVGEGADDGVERGCVRVEDELAVDQRDREGTVGAIGDGRGPDGPCSVEERCERREVEAVVDGDRVEDVGE